MAPFSAPLRMAASDGDGVEPHMLILGLQITFSK